VAELTQEKGIKDIVGSSGSLADAEPDQNYEELEKFDFLLTLDRDFQVSRNFLVENCPLLFRLGSGLGVTLIEGKEDPFRKNQARVSGGSFDIEPFVGFLARFGIGLRWQVHDNVVPFVEASYNLVYPFEIEVRENRERRSVDGDIDFGTILIGGGVAFEF
jgi:hypothetical protein